LRAIFPADTYRWRIIHTSLLSLFAAVALLFLPEPKSLVSSSYVSG